MLANDHVSYLIGGFRVEDQSGSDQCILLHDKTVYRRKPLLTGRVGAGVVLIHHHIYVAGGLKSLSEVNRGQRHPSPITSCERYDTLTNTWELIAP